MKKMEIEEESTMQKWLKNQEKNTYLPWSLTEEGLPQEDLV